MESEKIYLGFKNLGFKGGEEIEILKGIETEVDPVRCTVFREYPKYLVIDMEFAAPSYKTDGRVSHIKTGANKGAMLCGDVLLRRKSDGVILTKDEVGNAVEIGFFDLESCDSEWEKRLKQDAFR